MELGYLDHNKGFMYGTRSVKFVSAEAVSEYIFNFEGAVKYAWMKGILSGAIRRDEEIHKSGRWHISETSWDATDTLVPSIESAIRNIMLGQDYYRRNSVWRARTFFAGLFRFWLDTSCHCVPFAD